MNLERPACAWPSDRLVALGCARRASDCAVALRLGLRRRLRLEIRRCGNARLRGVLLCLHPAQPAGRSQPRSAWVRSSACLDPGFPSAWAAARGLRRRARRQGAAAAWRRRPGPCWGSRVGLRLGLCRGRRVRGADRANGGRDADVRRSAVSGFRRRAARWAWSRIRRLVRARRSRAAGARRILRSRIGEYGSPASRGRDEALKDVPAPGVDHQALIARRACADVGEIHHRSAMERRNQQIPLRLQPLLDVAGRGGGPRRAAIGPLQRERRSNAMSPPSAKPAKQRRRVPSSSLSSLPAPRVPRMRICHNKCGAVTARPRRSPGRRRKRPRADRFRSGSVSNEVTSLTSVSPFRGARSGRERSRAPFMQLRAGRAPGGDQRDRAPRQRLRWRRSAKRDARRASRQAPG